MSNGSTRHRTFTLSRGAYVPCVLAAACLVALAMDQLRVRTPLNATTVDGPVKITGVVTAAGRPQAELVVRLMGAGRRFVAETETDSDGRFAVSVGRPGAYKVMVSAGSALPSTSREVSLGVGHNDVVLDLPATEVRVTVVPADGPSPEFVQIVLHGPADETGDSRAGFVTRADGLKGRFVGVGFGEYRMSAFTTDGVPASSMEAAVFAVSSTEPVIDVTLHLVRRQLTVQVVGEDGKAIDYAEITALHRRLERTAGGAFDATWMPAGEGMVVRAAGMLSVCGYAGREGSQSFRLEPLKEARARIKLLDARGMIGGRLIGVRGSDCPVPVVSLDVDWDALDDGSVEMTIRGLPAGEYEYQAGERAPLERVRAPGEVLTYRVPPSCRMCGW